MEKYHLEHNLTVFGIEVKTFPNGIKEVFDDLIKLLPHSDQRIYYGISECTNKGITYIAATTEAFNGEGAKYGYERYVIEKGEYMSVTVFNWRAKTHLIKNVFEEMFTNADADRSKPCVEIYKNDTEMICIAKMV